MVLRFADAAPLGLLRHKNVMINPSRDERVQRGDKIIVLAEDDDSYEVGPEPSDIVVEHEGDVLTPRSPRPENKWSSEPATTKSSSN